MEEIDISNTELVWPGKYSKDRTFWEMIPASLPPQVIETPLCQCE